jgi:hypothetical protein
MGISVAWEASLGVVSRLGWPLHIRSVASLSDHEQQLTLIRALAQLYLLVCLFVCFADLL